MEITIVLSLVNIHVYSYNGNFDPQRHHPGGRRALVRWPKATNPPQDLEGGLPRGPNSLVFYNYHCCRLWFHNIMLIFSYNTAFENTFKLSESYIWSIISMLGDRMKTGKEMFSLDTILQFYCSSRENKDGPE